MQTENSFFALRSVGTIFFALLLLPRNRRRYWRLFMQILTVKKRSHEWNILWKKHWIDFLRSFALFDAKKVFPYDRKMAERINDLKFYAELNFLKRTACFKAISTFIYLIHTTRTLIIFSVHPSVCIIITSIPAQIAFLIFRFGFPHTHHIYKVYYDYCYFYFVYKLCSRSFFSLLSSPCVVCVLLFFPLLPNPFHLFYSLY